MDTIEDKVRQYQIDDEYTKLKKYDTLKAELVSILENNKDTLKGLDEIKDSIGKERSCKNFEKVQARFLEDLAIAEVGDIDLDFMKELVTKFNRMIGHLNNQKLVVDMIDKN